MIKNKTSLLRRVRNGLCLLLLAGMVACGVETEVAEESAVEAECDLAETEVVTSDTWDNNRFNSTFASNNYYEEWDANDDNLLDRNEYSRGFYYTWDTNNDNRLDENGWNTAFNDFGLEGENWSEWDTSGDGALDENEWNTGFADNAWYGESKEPVSIMRAVKAGVLALIVMNASMAAGFAGWQYGLLVLLLLPVSRYIAKNFAVT